MKDLPKRFLSCVVSDGGGSQPAALALGDLLPDLVDDLRTRPPVE
jgi:hypothetical protein